MTIYLDHAATSPMPVAVREAYVEALGVVGNPSSIHSAGQAARRMLEEARERIAASIGADSAEVTLTGGGTESVNLAIKGLFWARRSAAGAPARIVVPRGEHHATIDAVEWLERHEGAVVTWIELDGEGRVPVAALAAALGPDVALVTLLHANNEVGTVQDVAAVAAAAALHGIPVHVDAIASYGSLPIDTHALGVAALSVSAHKIGGPVGIGALAIARSARVEPLLHGGDQQRGRSGTMDAAGASAFGLAASLAVERMPQHAAHLERLRERLASGIQSSAPDASIRGSRTDRLPGNVHATFAGCEGDSLLFLLDMAGFAVSTGSACQAGVPEASHVLLAMGLSEQDARGALRFTLGPDTTDDEIDALLAVLPGVVAQARQAGLAAREPTLGRA